MSGPSDSDATDRAGRHDDAPPASVAAEAALLIELLSQRGSFASASAGSRSGSGPEPAAGSAGQPDGGECTCGGAPPAACRICPVCQVIAFVQKINPDTIERIADFATFAATALRDVASAQRTASSTAASTGDATGPDPSDSGHETRDRP
ncbi:MAG: hypothetical protein ABI112_18360 [Terracoccus sp.]